MLDTDNYVAQTDATFTCSVSSVWLKCLRTPEFSLSTKINHIAHLIHHIVHSTATHLAAADRMHLIGIYVVSLPKPNPLSSICKNRVQSLYFFLFRSRLTICNRQSYVSDLASVQLAHTTLKPRFKEIARYIKC